MKRAFALLICSFFLGAACSKKEEAEFASSAPEKPAAAQAQSQPTPANSELAAAQESMKKGEVDKAAAQLLQIQATTKNFSPQEAAQYRDVMSDAYSKALEAASRGDPRGVAAVQMIRAAAPR